MGLKELREDRLWSQAELARRSGVAERTVHSAEVGWRTRLDTKRKLLSALGIEFSRWREIFPKEYTR